MTDTLKPCPFCGGTDLCSGITQGGGIEWGYVDCPCGVEMSHGTRENAIAAWNTRTPSQELTELREALVRARNKFTFYEQCHRLKCTSEGDEKADRNREMADMCDKALGGNNPDTSGSKQ